MVNMDEYTHFRYEHFVILQTEINEKRFYVDEKQFWWRLREAVLYAGKSVESRALCRHMYIFHLLIQMTLSQRKKKHCQVRYGTGHHLHRWDRVCFFLGFREHFTMENSLWEKKWHFYFSANKKVNQRLNAIPTTNLFWKHCNRKKNNTATSVATFLCFSPSTGMNRMVSLFLCCCFILRMTHTQSYATISLIGYFRNVIVAVLLQKLCLR